MPRKTERFEAGVLELLGLFGTWRLIGICVCGLEFFDGLKVCGVPAAANSKEAVGTILACLLSEC